MLSYPVVDNNGIVDGVTDHGQDSGNKRLVNLEGERNDAPEEGEHPERNEGIVEQRHNAAQAEGRFAEPDKDVDKNHEQG